ncbi:ComEC/Rec2 family competence protein [Edaphocola aurantiacus]|uniref:ComEC/Rec2 family competence protein n=1 Tax=Edaphocola aurantiacus TaxID=2601682 RepID=UPI001C947645|nr:MBL fold metallo-hydrolase [Edaphocola aurantiacus]
MKFEIDVLNVGNADAIILRYIDDSDKEYVVLIDAGNKGDGEKVMEHIKNYTDKKCIDLAICTHPDSDHIGGFKEIVGNMDIKQFWIHDPKLSYIKDNIESDQHLKNTLLSESIIVPLFESIKESTELLSLIDSRKIPRNDQPFADLKFDDACLTVVGPSEDFYKEQVKGFRNIASLFESANSSMLIPGEYKRHLESVTQNFISHLNDTGKENNSSVILMFEPKDGEKYLFTADVGPIGLQRAIDSFKISDLTWLKVPHHGSRRNLEDLIVEKLRPKIAYISCKKNSHYPDEGVVKCLIQNRCNVYATYSGSLRLSYGVEPRGEYKNATPITI